MKIRYELRWGCIKGDLNAFMFFGTYEAAEQEWKRRIYQNKDYPRIIQTKEMQINLIISILGMNIPVITITDMNGNVTMDTPHEERTISPDKFDRISM